MPPLMDLPQFNPHNLQHQLPLTSSSDMYRVLPHMHTTVIFYAASWLDVYYATILTFVSFSSHNDDLSRDFSFAG